MKIIKVKIVKRSVNDDDLVDDGLEFDNSVVSEEVVEVSDDEVYRKSKKIIYLNSEIDRLKKEVLRLRRLKSKMSCDSVNLDKVLKVANAVNKSSKGKYVDG